MHDLIGYADRTPNEDGFIRMSIDDKVYQKKWQVLLAVMIGNIMGPLDASIVNTVLPNITNHFQTDIGVAQWVPTVYLLTISSLILLYGRLGDMLGYKKVFITGLAAFTITSVLCALSQSIWMLIAFRSLQGLAAGMMMSVSFAIITSAFPPHERGKALGISAIAISVGLAAGPTLGGLITEHATWRAIFLLNIPIGIFSFLWCLRVIPAGSKKPGQTLDYPGALAALVFLVTILLYSNRGQDWGWLSPAGLIMIAVAILSSLVFIWIEMRSPQPMLNLSLFSNRTFGFANLAALLSFMAIYGAIFLTPFYLVFVLKQSVGTVGIVMAASPLAALMVAPISGIISDRMGTRGLAFLGMGLSCLGLALLSTLNTSSSVMDVVWRLAIFGFGMGIFGSPNNSAVMGNVPPVYLGVASGILAAMRNVGMVLGIGIAAAVLYGIAPITLSGQPGSFTPAEIDQFLSGLHWAYITGAILAAASAVVSLASVQRRYEKEQRGITLPPTQQDQDTVT